MTKRTRLIILIVCIALFLGIAPYIVLYSLGYRVDFAHRSIVATGGIYVKALPVGADITIDGTIKNTTGIFYNSVFVQNLLPNQHAVSIQKSGYVNYQKNLMVKPNEVTKLEHVILFKQAYHFDALSAADAFYLAPNQTTLLTATKNAGKIDFTAINLVNNTRREFSSPIVKERATDQEERIPFFIWSDDSGKALVMISSEYFLIDFTTATVQMTPIATLLSQATHITFNPQNSNELFFIKDNNVYSSLQSAVLIKGVAAYKTSGQIIAYLGTDGFMYNYDTATRIINKTSVAALTISKNNTYAITANNNLLLAQSIDTLFLFNPATQGFEPLSVPFSPANTPVFSPDGQKALYIGNHEITYYSLDPDTKGQVSLYKGVGEIKNPYWLNNDYVIFSVGDNLIISEIDPRGNVSAITLPQTISLTNQTIAIKDPHMVFNSQDKKLYLLTQGQLVVSESLLP